jgi:hypothetical protein
MRSVLRRRSSVPEHAPRQGLRWPALAGWYVLAVVVGLGSAWAMLRSGAGFGEAVGPWRINTLAGSAQADLYTRARVALGGLLALSRGETMYYVAQSDSAGQPLRSRCTYRIEGVPPPARWWSITAYAEDFHLFPAQARQYSLNGSTAVLDEQGRFRLISAPDPQPARTAGASAHGWLHTPGDRGLMFTLRLYNPQAGVAQSPASLVAPTIHAVEGCR